MRTGRVRKHAGLRVRLVTSDAHAGLVAAIGATLTGAAWQRCRTHHAANVIERHPEGLVDVVGIFPDPNSIVRLVGAVLAEPPDEWA